MDALLSAWLRAGFGSAGTCGSKGAVKRRIGKDAGEVFGLKVQ